MLEKIIERLAELGKLDVRIVGGRFNGKTLELGYRKGVADAIEIVKEVAADINVGHKNGWIPCSERLPKGRETYRVLVTDKDGIMAVCYFLEVTEAFKVCWDGEEFCGGIAWQPLPEQYKEKK
jgi:hypothetical protein